ncbi:MAG TPA: prolyl oligopeptidase family serine peptidase [Capillimicrobium sp.]
MSERTVRVGGAERRLTLHDPGGAGPVPLILAFHGRWSSARELAAATALHRRANRAGAAVAYLHGVRDGWGDDPLPTDARPDPDADLRFAAAAVRDLVEAGVADRDRVSAVGHSNGGAMALRLAAERPGLLAAAAAVAGQLPEGVTPRAAVPVFLVYGTADPMRPADGLPGPHDPSADGPTPSLSIGATAAAFAGDGAVADERRLPDRDPADGTTVARTAWQAPGGAPVVLWLVEGGGHTWPGARGAPPSEGLGAVSRDLDATAVLVDAVLAQRAPRIAP